MCWLERSNKNVKHKDIFWGLTPHNLHKTMGWFLYKKLKGLALFSKHPAGSNILNDITFLMQLSAKRKY